MIAMFAIATALFGALLAQRFKVVILVPAIVINSAAILVFGIARNSNLWAVLFCAAVTITALQFGYLGGAVIRFVTAGAGVDRAPFANIRHHKGLFADQTHL